MTFRIAHATDVHWTEDVPWLKLSGKRLLGTANQVLRGRKHHFPEVVQQALVDHIVDLAPDLFVLTGDLTAQALPSEFSKARRFLQPLLDVTPTVVMAGNHDVYTWGSVKSDRLGEHFGPWLHRDGPIQRWTSNEVVVLALDPNRPTTWHASGQVPSDQLEALADALSDTALGGRFVVLALHYPILDRKGLVYDNPGHGLRNARELIGVLDRARVRPGLVIHGHEHHGFRVPLVLSDGHEIPCIDCGSSGYAWMPDKKRAAAMAVYTIAGGVLSVDRWMFDGTTFQPEAGGAFASGR